MKILKNKTRFFLKLYIVVWITLILLVLLKLLFGYWQPYVMPNEKMQIISDFIDNNKWLIIILDSIFYVANGILVLLCATKMWWFKSKKQALIYTSIIVLMYLGNVFLGLENYTPILGFIILPLIINYKRFGYMIATFISNFVFLYLSLWFNGNTNTAELPYLLQTLFLFDYYIMVVLHYINTNLINFKKKGVQ